MVFTRVLLLQRQALRQSWKEASSSVEVLRYKSTSSSSSTASTTTTPTLSSVNLPTASDENEHDAATDSQNPNTTTTTVTVMKPTSLTKAYADLAKARLSALVVSTTACGFLAAGGPFSTQLTLLGSCVVGTALCSSSAAAWNQIFEVSRDAKMKRTQQRPLVQGSLTLTQARTAAVLWGIGGVGLLHVGTDPTTTMLGLGNIALYSGLYTWMKPRTIWNTHVGALVGAIPPVMGWTAATGGSLFDVEAMVLGTTLFLWQMPHFFALSFMHRQDYARGGFQMVPISDNANFDHTAALITRYAAYLAAVPFVATFTGVTSSMFALEGIALNAYAVHVAHQFSRDRTNANARKVFLTSLWYLPTFMMLFLLHSRVWDEEENKEKDAVREWIADRVHVIREAGRQVCIHEKAIHHSDDKNDSSTNAALLEASKQACPVAFGSAKSREGLEILKRRASEAAVVATAVSLNQEAPPSSS